MGGKAKFAGRPQAMAESVSFNCLAAEELPRQPAHHMPMDDDAKTIGDAAYAAGDATLANVAPGTVVFGRYRLERELGRGGMGVVWLAHDQRVEMLVALKFLPDVVARDAECVNELKRELRRGLNLTHPGIVRLYSFEQDDQGAAISMEYVDGTTLGALKVKRPEACFDWDELFPWLEQLCVALDYAHDEAKIVHRDLKPRNLMLTAKGRLKVADFGVATSISDTVTRGSLRMDGSGTPPYMSPQQAFGENPSPSDDIYSLGATIYELLTGRAPFYQGNILAQVQQRTAPSMAERRQVLKVLGKKPIPAHWEKTVAACLAKQVEDRPQRANEVLDELRGLREPPSTGSVSTKPINPAVTLSTAGDEPLGRRRGEPEDLTTRHPTPPAPPPLPQGRAGRRKKAGNPGLAVAAIFSILLLGAAGWFWWQQQKPGEDSDFRMARKDDPEEFTPIAKATPITKAGPIPQADPVPQPEVSPPKDPLPLDDPALKDDPAAAAADAEAIAAGRIPRVGAPWTNSLFMKFVAIPGIAPLVCEHEVRVIDYHAFAVETKRPLLPTGFDQGENHPVVNVSWNDTQDFCEWLTKRERAEGKLGSRQRYRLLTDAEWSAAAGIAGEQGATPEEKDSKLEGIYPWGMAWPPPEGAGNLSGEGDTEAGAASEIAGYKDGYSHTAQVRLFQPNAMGVYDLAGNVAEWVEDWFNGKREERTTRGGAFLHFAKTENLSSFRSHRKPSDAAEYVGFRVAIDLGPQPLATALSPSPLPAPQAGVPPLPVRPAQ
jgi:serine/threonine protein kinase